MTPTVLVNFLLEDDPRALLNRTFSTEQIRHQLVAMAVEAAELVLPIFEREFPKDNRPRRAIEAAKAWLKNPTTDTKAASAGAEAAVYSVDNAANDDAADAADAAVYAADIADIVSSFECIRVAERAARRDPELNAKIKSIKAKYMWLARLLNT